MNIFCLMVGIVALAAGSSALAGGMQSKNRPQLIVRTTEEKPRLELELERKLEKELQQSQEPNLKQELRPTQLPEAETMQTQKSVEEEVESSGHSEMAKIANVAYSITGDAFTHVPQAPLGDLKYGLGEGWMDSEGLIWHVLSLRGPLFQKGTYPEAVYQCGRRGQGKGRVPTPDEAERFRASHGYELADEFSIETVNRIVLPGIFYYLKNRTVWLAKTDFYPAPSVLNFSNGSIKMAWREDSHTILCVSEFEPVSKPYTP